MRKPAARSGGRPLAKTLYWDLFATYAWIDQPGMGSMPDFSAKDFLNENSDVETSVARWRPGWDSDRDAFATLRRALEFVRDDKSKPHAIEIFVHKSDGEIIVKGDDLQSLVAQMKSVT